MAPFTVHVHATDSTVGTGSPLTASYEWSFGDPAGAYNELEGWNAAHVYDEPGTYQITLTITSEEGVPASTTVNVNVAPDTRPTLYVAANGNDSAAGTSEGAPIRTIDRVRQLLGDNTRVLLRRGNTFDVDDRLLLSGSNIVIGAYGNGADPVLRWNGPVIQFAPLIEVATSSSDITVQDIDLTSTYASGHDNSTPRGFMVAGSNVTVRRCTLNNLGQGMTSAPFGIQGWLTMDNTAGVLGTYYAWNRGRDICHIGNTVDDSMYEHNIRGQVLERVNVSHNNLFNTAKSNIWFMEGSYTWAGHNTLHGDSVAVGPNPVDAGSSRLLSYARLDSNDLTATTIRARSGMEHICFNNNIIREAPIVAFDIWGFTHYRGINLIKGEINGLSVARNINAGLNLETGAYQAANVYIETPPDQLPANCTFEDNCWTLPDRASCDGVFYAWGYWWSCDGYMNESEWGEIANTSGELYRDFQPSDFDPQGNPTFQTDAGALR
jgi:PKD repeat protein